MKTSLKQSSWIVRLLEKQSELQAMVNPGHSLFFPELLKIKMVRIDPETRFSSVNSSKDLNAKLSVFWKGFKESSVLKFGAFHCYMYVHV